MNALLNLIAAEMRHRWQAVRDTKDGGYTTEAVVATAVLVTLAILAIGIIYSKVSGKANSINLG
ncbi:hypothetical protein FB565_002970 [Actinoplanes lutulentus]|uniref:Flp pilus assembly pilin Flp n=1 Tax=Actinoplanes lutulentus TaxID=1287878 RepID=A0A327Z2R5_9ACTN|nr:hypothetical protein [Actinoplanes lutulentus]MBB2943257.1 hypothetical protein [Actinoplanes lutulentus]RAK28318.1 hypothetical protein B0I29_12086 [Actinoplanes lutulentus]